MSKPAENAGIKVIAQNKKARFNYHILETFEAGLALRGWEIKSIRIGEVSLVDAYVRPIGGELFLLGMHVNPYKFTRDEEQEARRERKLLMNKNEIYKLQGKVNQRGLTIVPLEIYLKRGFAKVKIALAKGKAAPDKRQTIKTRDAAREIDRAMKERTR